MTKKKEEEQVSDEFVAKVRKRLRDVIAKDWDAAMVKQCMVEISADEKRMTLDAVDKQFINELLEAPMSTEDEKQFIGSISPLIYRELEYYFGEGYEEESDGRSVAEICQRTH